MSKKELKKYLQALKKDQLEEQLLDLYARFKEVKVYYDFVFNPREDKLLEECKYKITKEYFPVGRRKPKARRSVAQKYIRHFMKLGMDPSHIAEIMLFNLETAQAFSAKKFVKQESFYSSMLKSFQEAREYVGNHGLNDAFYPRLQMVAENAWKQEWFNRAGFEV